MAGSETPLSDISMFGTWGYVQSMYSMPRSVAAYLDWASGVIRINASAEAWFAMLRKGLNQPGSQLSEGEQRLLETVLHEEAHFMQIVTTGYLYKFALTLYWTIQSWIQQAWKALDGSVDDRTQTLLRNEIPAQIALEVRTVSQQLDIPGPKNLTTRAIAETAALLVQKLACCPDISAETYRRILDLECPSPEYRSAFDVAHSFLGDDALYSFGLLSYLALCTVSPPRAFVRLCQGCADLGLARKGVLKFSAITRLLNDSDCASLGTAAEVAAALPDEHPIYTSAVSRLNELHKEGRLSLERYMVAPQEMTMQIHSEACRPIVFDHVSGRLQVAIPNTFLPSMTEEEKRAQLRTLLVIAAIHAKIMG